MAQGRAEAEGGLADRGNATAEQGRLGDRGPAGRSFGLGRGLEALIRPSDREGEARDLPIDRIARNPEQPRAQFDAEELRQLAASIALHGVLQPVVVRRRPHGDYELVAGERRLRAAKLAGKATIPAVVRDTSSDELLELALVENVQRSDLNPMDEAQAYRELTERFRLTHDQVATRVGKSRVAVTNALRLLEMAPETRTSVAEGRITEGHGRALASITDAEQQVALLAVVVERRMSVRQTEELVRRRRERAPRRVNQLSGDLQQVEADLRSVLATRVGIVRTRRGGRLVIDFYSDEELDRLYAIISRGARVPLPIESGSGS